jgi:gamma-glutamyl hydrolase
MLALALAAVAAKGPLIGIYPTMFPAYYEAYADWVAQAGGVSVVLPRNITDPSEVELVFQSISGLLIPGGEAFVGGGTVDALVARAARANLAEDDYFPIWGTCLGFEYLVDILGGPGANDPRAPDDPIVPGFDAEDLPRPLQFTSAGAGSRLLRGAGAPLLRAAQEENVTYNSHTQGVEPLAFERNPRLNGTLRVLGTSTDRNLRPFVALVEGIALPFYGSQFHPEKIEFVRCLARPPRKKYMCELPVPPEKTHVRCLANLARHYNG